MDNEGKTKANDKFKRKATPFDKLATQHTVMRPLEQGLSGLRVVNE